MFWKYNNPPSTQIETILAKEDVTLKEIMDEEDVLSECKVQNVNLMNFLMKPEILHELVTLTTTEPPADLDERSRYKYANVACELLTCDIPCFNECLARDQALLAKLYAFLDVEPPLNPLLASFFSKIMAVLIAKKAEQNWLSYQLTCLQVLEFLKAKDNFVPLLLKHLGTSAIMDLTLKLMTQVESIEVRQNILNYLDSERIVQSLIALLDPSIDRGRHHNVAQLLCDFVQKSRENQHNVTERNDPNPLLNTLESPETISIMLDHILGKEKSETAIVGGIQVLLQLLNKNSIPKYQFPNSYDNANYEDMCNISNPKTIESTCNVIVKRLRDFHNLLLDPPKKEPILTTVGNLSPPLGNTRLQVTRLLAALIACGGQETSQEIVSLGTMTVLIDLFFAFPWNNFLHSQVQASITAALNTPLPSEQGDNIALSKHLLINCRLVERILEAWKINDDMQSQTKGVRQGYMGHLINIANNLVNLCSEGPLGELLKDNVPEVAESLRNFKETALLETNSKQETLLGGVHPNTSNEDGDDYGEIPYVPTGLGHQNFSDYQAQQLGTVFFDSYGYNDEEFKDGDDALQTIEHRSGMNFDISEGDLEQQSELFKQVCAQNINTLDDADDQIFEDKDHTFQTVIEKEVERHSSSDSEDENSPQQEEPHMDVAVEPWRSPYKASEAPIIMADDPWASLAPTEPAARGWADFSSAVFEAKFDAFGGFDNKPETEEGGGPPKEEEAPPPPPIENDLKVENIEIDDGREACRKDDVDVVIAQGKQADVTDKRETNEQNITSDKATAVTEKDTTGSMEATVPDNKTTESKEGV